MIYTDGRGTIANVREDARRLPGTDHSIKVKPHEAYINAVNESLAHLPREDRIKLWDAIDDLPSSVRAA